MAPVALKPLPARKPVRRHGDGRGLIRVSEKSADAIDNPQSVEDWDDEELRRGRRKDRNGKFTGRDPIVVPTNCHREYVRRQLGKANQKMAESVEDAVQCLTDIIASTRADDRDRIAAAKLIMDRVMGTAPTKLEFGGKTPLFVGILQGGIVAGSLATDDPSIIDVESTDIEWDSN